MIVEVFVTRGDAEDSLGKQRSQVVGDLGRITRIGDAARQARRQAQLTIRLPELANNLLRTVPLAFHRRVLPPDHRADGTLITPGSGFGEQAKGKDVGI